MHALASQGVSQGHSSDLVFVKRGGLAPLTHVPLQLFDGVEGSEAREDSVEVFRLHASTVAQRLCRRKVFRRFFLASCVDGVLRLVGAKATHHQMQDVQLAHSAARPVDGLL